MLIRVRQDYMSVFCINCLYTILTRFTHQATAVKSTGATAARVCTHVTTIRWCVSVVLEGVALRFQILRMVSCVYCWNNSNQTSKFFGNNIKNCSVWLFHSPHVQMCVLISCSTRFCFRDSLAITQATGLAIQWALRPLFICKPKFYANWHQFYQKQTLNDKKQSHITIKMTLVTSHLTFRHRKNPIWAVKVWVYEDYTPYPHHSNW